MPDRHLRPNTITYNADVCACEKTGRWQPALQLLRNMPDLRLQPNTITCNAAISSCENDLSHMVG